MVQLVKVVRYIRLMMPTIRDKPGLRESIALLKSLVADETDSLTAETIDDRFGFIARNAEDLTNLELGLMRLEKAAHTSDVVIDDLVREVFAERRVRLREVA
jgi:hypothetical protein